MNSGQQTQDRTEMVTASFSQRVRLYFEELQSAICTALEEIDGAGKFGTDRWERPEGGGGLARVLEDGAVFEKAGVNTSTVFGTMPASIARKMNVEASGFLATGISLVVHPRSPMVPTVHMNYRYFERSDGDSWFGGGSDLTPYYLLEEDAIHFHSTLKQACDSVDTAFYPQFKKWCDEYFFIRHRNEARGVGGIFFDYLRGDVEKHFALARAGGDAFLESYVPIVRRRMAESWGEPERKWQLLRRGRYVEFNLVYDRGTTFGLETQGRTESILMSLPPHADWRYNVQPPAGTREAMLVEVLKNPRDWLRQ
jgi:coproporphyrinogen III oxidase